MVSCSFGNQFVYWLHVIVKTLSVPALTVKPTSQVTMALSPYLKFPDEMPGGSVTKLASWNAGGLGQDRPVKKKRSIRTV